MKWNNDKSIHLSILLVFLFGFILLMLDLFAHQLMSLFAASRGMKDSIILFLLSIYSGSVCAWICLYDLYRLLNNIRNEKVFISDNIRYLRAISWCLGAACFLCLLSSLYYIPFLFLAICAAFMMLIVRIVKNAFQQAILMKNDLDLTI